MEWLDGVVVSWSWMGLLEDFELYGLSGIGIRV